MSLTLHTNLGDIKIELFCEDVPKNCKNFLALAASGKYDNTVFHRNIKGFIVQGGASKEATKKSASVHGGYIEDEFVESLRHDRRGIVSMANGKGGNKNGSQFFITYAAQRTLDGNQVVIGKVIYGEETLDAMEKVPVDKNNTPLEDIVIKSVTIHANPFATR